MVLMTEVGQVAEERGTGVSSAHQPPYGASLIEGAGIAFRDTVEEHRVVRERQTSPATAQVVELLRQNADAGPILVDGVPLYEVYLKGSQIWASGWGSRPEARRLAQSLGTRLVEQ
jgi:hypothetical protein